MPIRDRRHWGEWQHLKLSYRPIIFVLYQPSLCRVNTERWHWLLDTFVIACNLLSFWKKNYCSIYNATYRNQVSHQLVVNVYLQLEMFSQILGKFTSATWTIPEFPVNNLYYNSIGSNWLNNNNNNNTVIAQLLCLSCISGPWYKIDTLRREWCFSYDSE